MTEPDENYEPGSPRSSRSSRASNSSSDGIAGLNLDLGSVQAPTGPDLVMAGPGARSANFGQGSRLSQYQDGNNGNNMQQGDDHDYAFLRQLLHGNGDNDNASDPGNVVNAIMQSQIGRVIGPQHAEQVLNRIQLPQPRAYNVQELNQLQQRRREQQQQRQLRIILQNCDRPRVLRLFASIDRAHRAHDARALRRAVQQLDHILEIPQRVINDASRSHSRAFERLFERLRCRTPEARRALHAFISGSRNQLRGRLHAMTARRRPQQQSQQSQQQPHPPKGGKRQTKKRAFKRNKTVKRRRCTK